ncbi:GMC family oxidoreductase N-terminal domain-containing protein, partial [Klebsiella pneumoniae]|uniref:GMC family oxidoreductase N-terminal domain-containing protein n=1 Tax=Klebsiella pneumoniae TaxID=573 RepID=UPI003EE3D024
EILDAFQAAAAEAGIPRTNDFNRGDNEGCGYFQVNQKNGIRWTSAKAFLRPVMGRQNLMVLTHSQAERVLLEDGRATGIAFRQKGRPVK